MSHATIPASTPPSVPVPSVPLPSGLNLAVGLAGVGWNAFGVVQFLKSLQNTPESLAKMGMTAEQAAVYSSYPAWMTAAFAVGVFGGLLGSVALVVRLRTAVPLFVASVVGYVALYVGDITEGVFAALGAPQITILTTVVAIAAALLVWSRRLARRNALR